MMVLEAPQGTDKSTALSILAVKEDWFSDTLPLNIKGRETIELTQGKWIIEAAELSGMKRADAEHLKAFMSRQVDVGRMAYGRVVTNVPRQFVVIGTTNSDDYLRDFTGNRRFWPVKVGRIDLDSLKNDRDQLWAEASICEADGISIRLPREHWPSAETEQVKRVTIDPYFDALQEKLNIFEGGKITALDAWKTLNIQGGIAQRTPEQNMRVGSAMKSLGWRREKIRSQSDLVNGYTKGPSPRKLIVVERSGEDVEAHYFDEVTAMRTSS
jgi:predicted P-loop ATPase